MAFLELFSFKVGTALHVHSFYFISVSFSSIMIYTTQVKFVLKFQKQFTNNTSACFNASSEGIYFISVIAVNKAAESSKVVCSDGVTVTTTIPFIKDFVFKDLKARNQILKDHNDTLWLLDSTLIRHKITDLSGLSG